ncbi:MAG: hypothetical protein HYZ14_11375 [Bacteroidetes bacterium]|nr:hypothetical protein [Bacteroidota bacterium]
MDGGGVLFALFLIAVIVLWTLSFVQLSKFESRGIKHFFLMFLLMLGIAGILFLVLIVPVLDCHGFLCGLGEFLVFLGACGLLLLIFPIILLTASVSYYRRQAKPSSDELIETD